MNIHSTIQYTNIASFSSNNCPVESTDNTTTTPEKSINDSGIDLISPQLNNTSGNKFAQFNSAQIITPTLPTTYNNNVTHKNVVTMNNNKVDSESSSESSDEEEDDSEYNEENEKPNELKSKKSESVSPIDNAAKPPKPYLEIIADAILSTQVKMMQLHEIYHVMEKKFQYFAKNVNKSWRNSVRHNLSLNECFVKAGRGSNGKGNYWKIHPLCEREFVRGMRYLCDWTR